MDMILAGGDPGTLERLAALCRESGGMGWVICASAGQALAYGEERPVDLLFLDMETLGRDGFELLRRLRSIHGEVQAAVIAADGRYALEAYQNDICDYILAPPDREAILRAVEKARRLIRGGRTQRVVLCTFGRFDLFVDGHAVDFKSRKAKELMAFLTAQKNIEAISHQVLARVIQESSSNGASGSVVIPNLGGDRVVQLPYFTVAL